MAIEFSSPEVRAILKADKELLYERRRGVVGTVVCKCGCIVELEGETEEWLQRDDGTFEHVAFGPGAGECECGALYVEDMDGRVLRLIEPEKETA